MRRSQASSLDLKSPSAGESVRVALVPMAWQWKQPSVLNSRRNWVCDFMFGIDAVAVVAGAGEFGLVRDLDEREPVDRRIILRRGGLVRRLDRGDVHDLAGGGGGLRRVDEAIAAHPHRVVRLRQVGHHVAALIVGDHDLDHLGREIGGLRNHPDAGLRPVRTGDDAAEVGVADADRRALLRPDRRRRADHEHGEGDRRRAGIQSPPDAHLDVPPLPSLQVCGAAADPGACASFSLSWAPDAPCRSIYQSACLLRPCAAVTSQDCPIARAWENGWRRSRRSAC